MNLKQFSLQFFKLLLFLVFVGIILFQIPGLSIHLPMYLFSVLAFGLLSLIIFFFSRFAASSANKGLFTAGNMGFSMFKLFLAVAIAYCYKEMYHPEGGLFLVALLISYFSFTIFEIVTLSKLGRT